MRPFILFLLGLGAAVWTGAWANDVNLGENVILPAHGHMTLAGGESDVSGAYVFNGRVELRGLIEVGWVIEDVTEKGVIVHRLQMLFLPEQSQVTLLPSLQTDVYSTQAGVLTIRNEDLQAIVRRHFTDIPAGFFQNEEGTLTLPATVVIEGYHTYVEGDCRYFDATLVSMRAFEGDLGDLAQKKCSGLNFAQDLYMTQSSDGYVNLRSEPSSRSEILRQLPNETFLEKIETQGNWYFVSLSQDAEVRRYVHKSQVVGAN